MSALDMPAHAVLLTMLERLSGQPVSDSSERPESKADLNAENAGSINELLRTTPPESVSRLLAYSWIQALYYVLQFLTVRRTGGPPSFKREDLLWLERQRYSIERRLIAEAFDLANPLNGGLITGETPVWDGQQLAVAAFERQFSPAMAMALEEYAGSDLPEDVRLAIDSLRGSGGIRPAKRILADIALLQIRRNRGAAEWFEVEVWQRLLPRTSGSSGAMETEFRSRLDAFQPDDQYDTFFDTRVRIQGRFLRYDHSTTEKDALASISPTLASAIVDTCNHWRVRPIALARVIGTAHLSARPTNLAEETALCRRVAGELRLLLDALSLDSNSFGVDSSDDYDARLVLEGLWEAGLHIDIGQLDEARREIERGRALNRARWLREAGHPENTPLIVLDHPFASLDAARYEELLGYLAKLIANFEDARQHYVNARDILTALMQSPAGRDFTYECKERIEGIDSTIGELDRNGAS